MASTAISTTTAATASAKSAALTGSGTTKDTANDSGGKVVASCMRSWNYAHKNRAEGKNPNPWECEKAGNKAYLNAVPPLSGLQNICDFIACINYASMAGIVTHSDATHYLANARIALAALSLRPKPQATGAKSGGKPLENPPGEEKE